MKLTLKKLIVLLTLTLATFQLAAQRYAGANLSYECVSSSEYNVRLEVFYNCAISNPSTLENVRVSSPSLSMAFVVSCSRVSIEEISQVCPSELDQTTCNGGALQGFYRLVYEGSFTHPGDEPEIALRWQVGNRMDSDNLDNSGGIPQYAHARLFPLASPCNSSPVQSIEAVPFFCTGEDVEYNVGMINAEPDDSLRFSFHDALIPIGGWTYQSAPYATGFTSDPPISGATIDPLTGTISFNAASPGLYTVALLVEEFDANGVFVGEQIFDQLFYIENCGIGPPESTNDSFTLESGTATVIATDSLRMCYGDDFCVSYDFTSPSPGAELSISTNVEQVIPGASVTTSGTNPLHVEICWTANPDHSQGPISVIASDDICDVNGISQILFFIEIVPGVYAGDDLYFCPGESVQLNASGSDNYTWTSVSGDPESLFDCTDCADPIFSPTQSSIFQVEGSSSGNGCSTTDQVSVEPTLNYSLNIVGADCDGENGEAHITILTGSEDYSIEFDGISEDLTDNLYDTIGLAVGTYPVTLFDDENMCSTSFDVEVSIGVPIPDPDIIQPNAVCGYSVTLDASVDNAGLAWTSSGPGTVDFNATDIEDPTITVSAAGNYWFYLIETHDISGCTGIDSVQVQFSSPPDVVAGPDTSICGLTYSMPGSASSGSFQWFELGPGAVTYTPSSNDPGADISVSAFGNYQFLWNFTGANGCDSSGTVNIQFLSPPVAESPDTLTFCQLDDNFLSATPAQSGQSGSWQIQGGTFLYNPIVANSPIDNQTGFGEYLAIWTVSNAGCSDSDTTLLRYVAPEEASISGFDIQVCGPSTSISAENISGTWSSPDPELNFTDPDSPNTTVSSTSSGAYTLIWTVGQGVCADSDSRNIVFYDSAQVDITSIPTEICSIDSIALTGSVQNEISYVWSSDGDGTFLADDVLNTIYVPGVNDSINGTVEISLSADGESLCPVVTDIAEVTVIRAASVSADVSSPADICSDGFVFLNGSSTNINGSAWTSTGDGTLSNTGEDPTYFPGPTDISNGGVTWIYTGLPDSPVCPAVMDSVQITITEAPYAGVDSMLSVCISAEPFDISPYFGVDTDLGGNYTDDDASGALSGNTFSPLTAGLGIFHISYEVEGVDPCTEDVVTLTIEVTDGADAGMGTTIALCDADPPIDLFAQLSGTPQSDGTWVDADNSMAISANNFDPSVSGQGEFTIYYVTSREGCANDTATIEIGVGTELSAQFIVDTDSICQGDVLVLDADIDGFYDTLFWQTDNGGLFTFINGLPTTYLPSDPDIDSGQSTIRLNLGGTYGCPDLSTDFDLTIIPQANAGSNNAATLCNSSSLFDLNSLLSPEAQAGGTWSDDSSSGALSGSTFDPSVVSDGVYEFSYLVSGEGICTDSSSTMTLTVSSSADAGEDGSGTYCEGNQNVSLFPILTGSPQAGGTWNGITSSTGLDPSTGLLNLNGLTPGSYLYRYTVEIPDCSSIDQSDITIQIEAATVVDIITTAATICESDELSLTAIAQNHTDLLWTSSGDGSFDPSDQLSSSYTPGGADISSEETMLYLTASGSGVCPMVSDSLLITVAQRPEASILGSALSTCGTMSVQLDGDSIAANSIFWDTPGGDGSFSDPSIPDPTYTPGPSDVSNGAVTLRLTASGSPACPDDTEEVSLTIFTPPYAGDDGEVIVCQSGQAIDLTDHLDSSADSGGSWTDTDGSGALTGSVFDPMSTSSGVYNITYTVPMNGGCSADQSVVEVEVTEGPYAGESNSSSVCASVSTVDLNSLLGGDPDNGGIWTDVTGSGALSGSDFNPSIAGVGSYVFRYRVSLTGCTDDSTDVTVEVTAAPIAEITTAPTSICSGEDFPISALTSNSTSLTWSTSGTGSFSDPQDASTVYTPSVADINAGSATLTITAEGAEGCSPDEESIILQILTTPVADAGVDIGQCGSQIGLSANASIGIGQWQGPIEVTFDDENDPNTLAVFSTPGDYLLTWSETNGPCTDDDQVLISSWDAPDTLSTTTECINTNTEYVLTMILIGGDPGSYEVSGSGSLSGNVFTSTPIPTGSDYSFVINDIHDCEPLILEGEFTCPALTHSGSLETDTIHSCAGSAAQALYNEDGFLDANDVLQFILLSEPGNLSTILATSNSSQFPYQPEFVPEEIYYIHSVAGNDDGTGNVDFSDPGVSVSSPVPVIFHALPVLSLQNDVYEVCTGSELSIVIDLVGHSPFEFSYSYAGETLSTTTSGSLTSIVVSEAGTISFISLADNYCVSPLDTEVEILENPLPTATLPTDFSTCDNVLSPVPLTLSGSGPWNYSLSINGIDQGIQVSLNDETELSPSQSGTYVISDISDMNCTNPESDSVMVDILPSPIADAGPDLELCSGDTVMVGTVGEVDVIYSWDGPSDVLIGSNGEIVSATAMSTSGQPIDVELILTADLASCSDMDPVVLTVNPLPNNYGIDAPETLCDGDSVIISAYGGVSYAWGAHPSLSDTSVSSPIIYPSSSTTYTVTIQNQYSCAVEDEVSMVVNPSPVAQISTQVLEPCLPARVMLFNESPTSTYVGCEWNHAPGTSVAEDCSFIEIEYNSTGSFLNSLTIYNEFGCADTSPQDTVTIEDAVADFAFFPEVPTHDHGVIQVIDASGNAVSQIWTIDGVEVGTGSDPELSILELRPDHYDLCLSIVTEDGCTDTLCKRFRIEDNVNFWMPNSFTPNDDGLNESLFPVFTGSQYVQTYVFQIFNRRGHLIYETDRIGEGWDGKQENGKVYLQGLFQWRIVMQVFGEVSPRQYLGNVTLLK